VRQLFTKWQEVELKPVYKDGNRESGRKDGGAGLLAAFELHVFPKLGGKVAGEVTRGDVMDVFDRCRALEIYRTMNILLQAMRQMFAFGIIRELVKADPTAGIKRKHAGGKDVKRKRALSADEIKALHTQLPAAKLNKRTELAVWLMIATVCRVGELTQARWSDLDLDAGTWSIPAEHSKNQRPHLVHLSAFAKAAFAELLVLHESLTWVFPSRDGKSHLDLRTISKQLADRQAADREVARKNRTKHSDALQLDGGHWTPHDLRRTGATLMSKLGASTEVVHLCQNHRAQDELTDIYIQNERMPERKAAFELLGRELAQLTGLHQPTRAEDTAA
jgi:integrase